MDDSMFIVFICCYAKKTFNAASELRLASDYTVNGKIRHVNSTLQKVLYLKVYLIMSHGEKITWLVPHRFTQYMHKMLIFV